MWLHSSVGRAVGRASFQLLIKLEIYCDDDSSLSNAFLSLDFAVVTNLVSLTSRCSGKEAGAFQERRLDTRGPQKLRLLLASSLIT